GLSDSVSANPKASPMVTTTYFLTVFGTNICPDYDTVVVVVNDPPAPKLTASGPTTFCVGGNVKLSAPGGYTNYLWNNGATTSSIVTSVAGDYSVLVTNTNGCMGRSDTITVAPPV